MDEPNKKSAIVDTFVAPQCHDSITTIFEDQDILVINKPSGLLSLSGKNPKNIDSVHYRLAQQYAYITLLHRLDFGTSGVMLLAKNKQVNANLSKQFQNRTVVKRYVSILAGHLRNNAGVIDFPIAKDASLFPRLKICEQSGKTAQTHYRVIDKNQPPKCTKVLFTPITGRTHQLRLHSQAIGHPILGCDLYGTDITQNMASRLMLHALDLSFEHPRSCERITISSPMPF